LKPTHNSDSAREFEEYGEGPACRGEGTVAVATYVLFHRVLSLRHALLHPVSPHSRPIVVDGSLAEVKKKKGPLSASSEAESGPPLGSEVLGFESSRSQEAGDCRWLRCFRYRFDFA